MTFLSGLTATGIRESVLWDPVDPSTGQAACTVTFDHSSRFSSSLGCWCVGISFPFRRMFVLVKDTFVSPAKASSRSLWETQD